MNDYTKFYICGIVFLLSASIMIGDLCDILIYKPNIFNLMIGVIFIQLTIVCVILFMYYDEKTEVKHETTR